MKYKFIGIPAFLLACIFIYGHEGGSFAFLGIGKRHLPDIIVLGTSFDWRESENSWVWKKLETGAQKAGTIQLLRMINLHSQIVVSHKFTDEFGNHDISFFDENWEKVG